MQSAKEKISNMGSAAKLHINICKAKAEEKVQKATARTEEEKEIAHERRKMKEAQAKMELHQEKAEHAAEKLRAKQSHSHQLYAKPLLQFEEPPGMASGHASAHAHALAAPPTTTYPFGKQPRVTGGRHKFI